MEGAPKLRHTKPPSVEYCQVPFVLSTAVTAIPPRAPVSTSAVRPAISADTSVPGCVSVSSLIAVSALAPVSVGAELLTMAAFRENSELLPTASVAVAVSESPTATVCPVRSNLPANRPSASAKSVPR